MANHSWTYAYNKAPNGPYQGPFRCSRCGEVVEQMNPSECPISETLDDATRADLNQKIQAMKVEIERLKKPDTVEPTPTTWEESLVQRLAALESWKDRANQRLTEDAHANAKRNAKIRELLEIAARLTDAVPDKLRERLDALEAQPGADPAEPEGDGLTHVIKGGCGGGPRTAAFLDAIDCAACLRRAAAYFRDRKAPDAAECKKIAFRAANAALLAAMETVTPYADTIGALGEARRRIDAISVDDIAYEVLKDV